MSLNRGRHQDELADWPAITKWLWRGLLIAPMMETVGISEKLVNVYHTTLQNTAIFGLTAIKT